MSKSIWCKPLLALAIVSFLPTFCAAEGDDQPEFSVLARRYRIEVYNTYRTDRAEYERRQLLGRFAEWLYEDADSLQQQELRDWAEQARLASVAGSDAEFPLLPAQDEYDTLDQYAEAIQYDENAVQWLRDESLLNDAIAQGNTAQPETGPRSNPVVQTGSHSTRTPVGSGTTTQSWASSPRGTASSSKPQGSILSRVVRAVSGADGATDGGDAGGAPGKAGGNVTATDPASNSAGNPNHTGAANEGWLDEGLVDEGLLGDTLVTEGSDTTQPTSFADHRENLNITRKLLDGGTEQFDVDLLDLQTTVLGVWFIRQDVLEATNRDDATPEELAQLRSEAEEVVQQLLERCDTLLLEAEDANDPSAAHQAELEKLRTTREQLQQFLPLAE